MPQGDAGRQHGRDRCRLRVGEVGGRGGRNSPTRRSASRATPANSRPGAALTDHFLLFAGPKQAAAAGPIQAGRCRLLRLVRLGGQADAAGPAPLLLGVPQLRAGHHPADGAGAGVHVPLEPQAGPGRPEDAGAAAGDQEDPGEVQEGHGGAEQGPAGAVPQAQLQSARRLPGDCSSSCRSSSACTAR